MPAVEITLSMVEEAGTSYKMSLYWGDSDSGNLIYNGLLHEVPSGLSEIRELVFPKAGFTDLGGRE